MLLVIAQLSQAKFWIKEEIISYHSKKINRLLLSGTPPRQVSDYMKANSSGLEKDTDVDFGSGRIETRVCYLLKDLRFIENVQRQSGTRHCGV